MSVVHSTGVATDLSTECIVIYQQMISNFKDLHRLPPPCYVRSPKEHKRAQSNPARSMPNAEVLPADNNAITCTHAASREQREDPPIESFPCYADSYAPGVGVATAATVREAAQDSAGASRQTALAAGQ